MATHGLPAWPWTRHPVAELPAAERLLLDAARAWAQAARLGHPPSPALQRLLVTEDAASAAVPLDALLRLTGTEGVGCAFCAQATEAEAWLLLSCALVQHGAKAEALAQFLRRLPLPNAYRAMPPALGLGVMFRRAGLVFARPFARG